MFGLLMLKIIHYFCPSDWKCEAKCFMAFVGFIFVSACSSSKLARDAAEHRIDRVYSGNVTPVLDYTETAESYKPIAGVGFTYAPPSNNKDPVYPESLLGMGLPPVTVSVRVVVNSAGEVERVDELESTSEFPQFMQEVTKAIMQWKFSPLIKIENGIETPILYSDYYKFAFNEEVSTIIRK